MGILSLLFGKSSTEKQNAVVTYEETAPIKSVNQIPVGLPDENGLYVADLVMLAKAESYPVTGANYQGYLKYEYGIEKPSDILYSLKEKGLIKKGSAVDALPKLKVTELTEITTTLGLKCKKQKNAMIELLSAQNEELVSQACKVRYWKLTDNGESVLKKNAYVPFFLGKHPYSLKEIGITIFDVNEYLNANPKARYRDAIWRLLYSRANELQIYMKLHPHTGTAVPHNYCNVYRVMGLFVEEERQFVNARDFYFQYIFKSINLRDGAETVHLYRITKGRKERDSIASGFYNHIQLMPFQKDDIKRLMNESGINTPDYKYSLIQSFDRVRDECVFSKEDVADFVIYELNEDTTSASELSKRMILGAIK